MAKILLFEPEARYRLMLRFVLEGINYRVLDASCGEDIPILLAADKPDLIILGVHLGEDPGMLTWQEWQLALPEVPTLILFSGEPGMRAEFLEAWSGARPMNMMVQPVEPYPLLAMVKAMLMPPVEWRRGGQHAL
jgi:DNA-binding response OmpR family regulator